jgi:hypothetical protein
MFIINLSFLNILKTKDCFLNVKKFQIKYRLPTFKIVCLLRVENSIKLGDSLPAAE